MYLTKRIYKYKLKEDTALFFNTISGAVDIMDKDSLELLNAISAGKIPDNENNPVIDALKERKYLFDSEEEEKTFVQALYEKTRKQLLEQPLKVVICPTSECNLQCTYCFQNRSATINREAGFITGEQIESIFKNLGALKKQTGAGQVHFVLFGGEPLLPGLEERIDQILSGASALKSKVTVISNAVNLESHYAKILTKYKNVISEIQVTIDGLKEIHDTRRIRKDGSGSFDTIVKSIDFLIRENIGVNLRVNVDKENISSIDKLVYFIEEKRWLTRKHFSSYLSPVTDHKCTELRNVLSEYEILKQVQNFFKGEDLYMKKFVVAGFRSLGHIASVIEPDTINIDTAPLFQYCEANNGRMLYFCSDGLVYPCGEAVFESGMEVGSYHPELVIHPEKLQEWTGRSILTIDTCRDCPVATICGGGCAFTTFKRTKSFAGMVCNRTPEILTSYLDTMKDEIIRKFT